MSKKLDKNLVDDTNTRISKIFNLKNVPEVTARSLQIYFTYLSKNLVFPINGEVSQDETPFEEKTFEVELHSLILSKDDLYGILAEGKGECKNAVMALAEFTVTDLGSNNYQLVEDYKDWFWNNR